ncbi:MAG TPA: fused MFS/spermidine synthase [Planctomycetota bacterium]|nr:fused MFS/spermidine synthase [Planctomycetota bacterium]
MRALVLAFFFISGFCGLVDEVVWIRVAGTVIGNTTFAIGTVVGVFMGGLALGAWWGGRQADRRQGAALLRLYGLLEGGIALSALAVPLLIAASEPLYHALWNSVGQITALYAALRVLLVGVVLIVPTTLMGATLPVLTRYLSDSGRAAAGEAGRAYAINTFGGVAGTLASGLWLIPTLGLQATILVAVALNAAIAAASVALARGKTGTIEPALTPEPPPQRAALIVAALSGFSSLVYEVAWTRSLVLSLGSTVYAFTLILTAFILGLGAGSAVSSRLVLRARQPDAALAGIQAAIGLTALILLPFLGDLPLRMAPASELYRDCYAGLLFEHAKLIALFVFTPSLFIGAVFPFAFRLAAGTERAVGRSVAAVYSWNTVGSIAGSLAASFALVPMLGLAPSIRIAATVNLAAAAGLLALIPQLRLVAVAPVLVAGVAWLRPSWDSRVLASGAYLYGEDYRRMAETLHMDLPTYLARESKILAEYWDAYGLTTVHRSEDSNLSIRVNGKADASTGTADMPTQRTIGHLGLLHHPAPKRALVIGLGSGVTLGAVACHDLQAIDCVEISPAGVRAAEYFTDANGGVLKDPRVRLMIGDGRNAVQFAKEPYDVIVSQPSNLWISGMSNLFTRDFFVMASKRLAPGGIFCQWVQAYRMPVEDFRSILKTFFAAFPNGSFWEVFPGQDYVLLGSVESPRIAFADLETRMGARSMRTHFDGLSTPGAVGLLGHYIAPAEEVRAAVADAAVLTDDLSAIEYSASRAMFMVLQPRTIAWVEQLRKTPMDPARYPGVDAAAVERSRDARRRIAEAVALEAERRSVIEVLEFLAKKSIGLGDDEPTRQHFERYAYLARLEARFQRQSGHYTEAGRLLRAVPRTSKHYVDALFERALVAQAAGRANEAEMCVREILGDHPGSFAALCLQAQGAQSGAEAVERWKTAIALRPDSDFAHAHLASVLMQAGRSDEAREEALKALELEPGNALAKQLLAR